MNLERQKSTLKTFIWYHTCIRAAVREMTGAFIRQMLVTECQTKLFLFIPVKVLLVLWCYQKFEMEVRTNRAQLDKMVEMLEKEPEIARALHKGDQTVFWETLAENVNALGPPVRQASVWKKVWFDFKCSVKKKLREATATGGGPNKQKFLNELEERVADLTNLRTTIQNFGRSCTCTSLVVHENIEPARKRKKKNTEAVLDQNAQMIQVMKENIDSDRALIDELKKNTKVHEEGNNLLKNLLGQLREELVNRSNN